MILLRCHAIVMLLTKLVKGSCPMKCVRWSLLWKLKTLGPGHLARMLWGGWRVTALRVRRLTVVKFWQMSATLMRATLMFNHGGFAAETLYTAVMLTFVRSFPSVDASMSCQTWWLGYISLTLKVGAGWPTSENRLPQPICPHWCGFSPVCVRMWTVSALLWMKLLPHPGVIHEYGRSLVWIR